MIRIDETPIQLTPVPTEVYRGSYKAKDGLFGPLPACQLDQAVAYEFELPERFEPWPGRTRLERTYVLLDVGVGFSQPCWQRATHPGRVDEIDGRERGSWYVDLITVERQGSRYIFRDFYLDVIVPMDGRPPRFLDMDEYADAMADGTIPLVDAIDGLRRWQRFMDRYLYRGRWPTAGLADFPPKAIQALAAIEAPLGRIVRWEG